MGHKKCLELNCQDEIYCRGLCAFHYRWDLIDRPQIFRKNKQDKLFSSLENKFLANFTPKTDSECWEWEWTLNSKGYGKIAMRIDKKLVTVAAHRYSFEHFNKIKLNSKQFVCHHCDNPKCVNPKHLFLGTNQQNQQDASIKNKSITKAHNKKHYFLRYEHLKD